MNVGPLEISVSDLSKRLKSGEKIFILDVRENWEYQTARLEPSHLIPLGNLPEHLDELDKGKEIIIICHHGRRSLHAAYLLKENGFSKVKSLAGGIEAWSEEIDPQVPRY